MKIVWIGIFSLTTQGLKTLFITTEWRDVNKKVQTMMVQCHRVMTHEFNYNNTLITKKYCVKAHT